MSKYPRGYGHIEISIKRRRKAYPQARHWQILDAIAAGYGLANWPALRLQMDRGAELPRPDFDENRFTTRLIALLQKAEAERPAQ